MLDTEYIDEATIPCDLCGGDAALFIRSDERMVCVECVSGKAECA